MLAMQLAAPGPAAAHPLVQSRRGELAAGPGEIVVRVAACGVCRTDLQICEGDLAAKTLPIVPGHQIVGRVAQVGASVARWRPGDRVGIAWLGSTDGTCSHCTGGRE